MYLFWLVALLINILDDHFWALSDIIYNPQNLLEKSSIPLYCLNHLSLKDAQFYYNLRVVR